MKLIYSLFAVLFITACTEDLEGVNVDPTQPTNARTDLMMTGSIRTVFAGTLQARDPIFYVQHLAETQYTSTSTYSNTQFDYTGIYTGPLNNIKTIIDLNTDTPNNPDVLAGGSNDNQIAAATTLWSWLFWRMTDRWGYLPYSEALKGVDNTQPSFDTQEAIYTDIFAKLKSANDQFDTGSSLKGDILLNGDISQWKVFANTTRMLAALRLSDAMPALAEAEFKDAMSAGVISSNSENIFYQYLDNDNNYNFWYNNRYQLGRRDYALSDTMVDRLKELDDPRLFEFADKALNSQEYVGMPFGLSEADAGAISNNEVSYMNQDKIQNVPNLAVPVVTYSTVLFAMAEAAEKGWIAGSASDLYNQAIQASWEMWGADMSNYATYIAQPDVAYSSSNWKQLIGEQKWIALFLDGYEAWAEYRRLDAPQLTAASAAANESGSIPVRQAYPSSAELLNEASYEAAVSAQGADDLDTKLFWDVN